MGTMPEQELIHIEDLELDGRRLHFEQGTLCVDCDESTEETHWSAVLFHSLPDRQANTLGDGEVIVHTTDGDSLRGHVSPDCILSGAGSLLLRGIGPLEHEEKPPDSE